MKPFIEEILRSSIGGGLLLDIMATMVGLALRMLFSDVSFEAAAVILRRLAFLFGMQKTKAEAMRALWNIALEATQVFTVHERANPLLAAVREVNAEKPGEIIELVQDGRLVVAVLGAVFPIYNVASAPAVPDHSSEAKVMVMRNFPPCLCAAMALTRRAPHAIEMRQRLRAGEDDPALEVFQQVKVIRDSIIAHFNKERKP